MLFEGELMSGIPVFDAHCDTISRALWKSEGIFRNTGMVELEKTASAFGRYCQIFSLFANSARPGHATYAELLNCFRGQMAENCTHICHCCTAEEAEVANRQGKAAAFLSVEGAELLNCSIDELERAAADGAGHGPPEHRPVLL